MTGERKGSRPGVRAGVLATESMPNPCPRVIFLPVKIRHICGQNPNRPYERAMDKVFRLLKLAVELKIKLKNAGSADH